MNLGMFDRKQCEPNSSELDYTGRVLVLSPNTLKEEYWSPENQLWLAESGFGCSPTARGRSILCVCLGDGEQTRWNRNDFVGVLQAEFLPDWAKESLKQYQRSRAGGNTGNAAWRDVNLDRKMVKFIQEQYPPGTRIRLNSMNDHMRRLPPVRRALWMWWMTTDSFT